MLLTVSFWITLLPGLVAISTLLLGVGTVRGRHAIGYFFRGQSMAELSKTAADEIQTVKAAYDVVNAELERQKVDYEARILELMNKVEAQTQRISVLEDLVKGNHQVEALSSLVTGRHEILMKRLDDIAKAVKCP